MDKNVKFDIVIGNPPYDKSLHLKILRETMKHVDFDNGGEVVWLHPANWLMFPCREKTRDFDGYIRGFELLDHKKCNEMFGINGGDLVISLFKKNGQNISDFNCFEFNSHFLNSNIIENIFKKIIKLNLAGTLARHLTKFTQTSFAIKTLYGVGWGEYNTQGGSTGYRLVSKNIETAFTNNSGLHVRFLNFDSETERKNAWASFLTDFARFCVMLDESTKLSPWMGDAVNPRTGLKGYQGEWTDKDFFDYFKLTDEERDLVKKTMAK